MKEPIWSNADNYGLYVTYLELKDTWQENYRGIRMIDALAADIISLYVTDVKPDWYHVGCELLKRLKTDELRQAFTQATNVFTFNAPKRRDHRELSHLMQESVTNSTWLELTYRYTPWGVIVPFIREYRNVRKHIRLSLVQRCYLAACMVAYKKNIDLLSRCFRDTDLHGKRLVPFSATTYQEALLTLFFRSCGVVTYTTFHGILGHYMQHITNDVVTGINILSDYALSFSREQQADLVKHFGIKPEIIRIAGNPKYPERDIQFGGACQKCLILSGVSRYDDDLRQLLPMAEEVGRELGIEFSLKPHPSSGLTEADIEQYAHMRMIDRFTTIKQLLSSGEYTVAITHNTSAYYECMYYGVRPMRWGLNENLDFRMLDDRFMTKQELMEGLSGGVDADYTNSAKQLLTNVLGVGINKYDELINAQ